MGPSYTFGGWAAQSFNPLLLALLRCMAAALIFGSIFFVRGGLKGYRPTRYEWKWILKLAVMGVLLNQFLFTLGLRYTTPANASLLFAMTPLWVLIFATLLLKSERLTRHKLLGISVAFGGLVVVFLGQGGNLSLEQVVGNVLVLGAVLGWAGYLVQSSKVLSRFDNIQGPALILMMGALLYLPIGALSLPSADFASIPRQGWIGLAVLVIGNSTLSFLLLNFALKGLKASQVAVYGNLEPIVATLFSVLIIGEETIGVFFVLGTAAVLGGVYLINRAQQRESVSPYTLVPVRNRRRPLRMLLHKARRNGFLRR